MSEEIKNNQIPEKIKDICRSCEENIHCQNKGCAFRSLGNEYCDYILNATKLYLYLQQKVEQLENIRKEAMEYINRKNYQPSPLGFELELNPKELYQLKKILNKGE